MLAPPEKATLGSLRSKACIDRIASASCLQGGGCLGLNQCSLALQLKPFPKMKAGVPWDLLDKEETLIRCAANPYCDMWFGHKSLLYKYYQKCPNHSFFIHC
jgi:hypothetical protein|uniref:Prpf18 protein n=1 Tax=Mus musculus TaxID=10090 RepID=Q9CYU9_MOUSE|nr:Prpf18 protein [Mus musculus]BAB28767.1 unnamed protein product [Mus musculus]